MKELLLWIIGLQKINRTESALFTSIQADEIKGQDAAAVLNQLLLMKTIEEAETLALTSGGLRTIRALFLALEILKSLANEPEILNYAKMEYPYQHLVERGKILDYAAKLNNESEVEEDLEVEEEEDEEDEEFEDEDEEEEGN